jgi:hypothetical protein
MARREKKSPKHYPHWIVFDENLEGVADVFEIAKLNLPEIGVAVKGVTDHNLEMDLNEQTVFFTGDTNWFTRQPPYKHGGIIVLDTGNLTLKKKAEIIRRFLFAFHWKNKSLDMLKNKRYCLTQTTLSEVTIDGQRNLIWRL